MKAKPYKIANGKYLPCEASEADHVLLHMPGPLWCRRIPVIQRGKREGTGCWTWNGDTEKPTLKPSILSRAGEHRCHSFVNDGKVIFLSDCSHEFAGKTMDLLEVED
jgi:hypothetical protein